jgi:hypothetical protein
MAPRRGWVQTVHGRMVTFLCDDAVTLAETLAETLREIGEGVPGITLAQEFGDVCAISRTLCELMSAARAQGAFSSRGAHPVHPRCCICMICTNHIHYWNTI